MQLFLNFNLHAQSLGYVHAPRTKQKISQFYFQQKKKGKRISTQYILGNKNENNIDPFLRPSLSLLVEAAFFSSELEAFFSGKREDKTKCKLSAKESFLLYSNAIVCFNILLDSYALERERERGTLIPKYSKTDHGTDLSMQIMNIMFHSRNKKFERYMSLILVERYERVA